MLDFDDTGVPVGLGEIEFLDVLGEFCTPSCLEFLVVLGEFCTPSDLELLDVLGEFLTPSALGFLDVLGELCTPSGLGESLEGVDNPVAPLRLLLLIQLLFLLTVATFVEGFVWLLLLLLSGDGEEVAMASLMIFLSCTISLGVIFIVAAVDCCFCCLEDPCKLGIVNGCATTCLPSKAREPSVANIPSVAMQPKSVSGQHRSKRPSLVEVADRVVAEDCWMVKGGDAGERQGP